MATYLNNALASSMLPDGVGIVRDHTRTLTVEEAREWLSLPDGFIHAGNPQHANTWHAVAKRLDIPAAGKPKGGKIILQPWDTLIVAEISGLPRETREFTDEEIGKALILFRSFTAC